MDGVPFRLNRNLRPQPITPRHINRAADNFLDLSVNTRQVE
jgi:hypothetical protein